MEAGHRSEAISATLRGGRNIDGLSMANMTLEGTGSFALILINAAKGSHKKNPFEKRFRKEGDTVEVSPRTVTSSKALFYFTGGAGGLSTGGAGGGSGPRSAAGGTRPRRIASARFSP